MGRNTGVVDARAEAEEEYTVLVGATLVTVSMTGSGLDVTTLVTT